jgi:hypothetical protein
MSMRRTVLGATRRASRAGPLLLDVPAHLQTVGRMDGYVLSVTASPAAGCGEHPAAALAARASRRLHRHGLTVGLLDLDGSARASVASTWGRGLTIVDAGDDPAEHIERGRRRFDLVVVARGPLDAPGSDDGRTLLVVDRDPVAVLAAARWAARLDHPQRCCVAARTRRGDTLDTPAVRASVEPLEWAGVLRRDGSKGEAGLGSSRVLAAATGDHRFAVLGRFGAAAGATTALGR